jgi:hypothetical protein
VQRLEVPHQVPTFASSSRYNSSVRDKTRGEIGSDWRGLPGFHVGHDEIGAVEL